MQRMPAETALWVPSELTFRIEGRRIWIAGHRGMVGSALMRRLAREDCELVTADRDRLDLRRQAEVQAWMHEPRRNDSSAPSAPTRTSKKLVASSSSLSSAGCCFGLENWPMMTSTGSAQRVG